MPTRIMYQFMWLFDVVVVVRDWHCFALSSLNNWFRARQTDGEKERER